MTRAKRNSKAGFAGRRIFVAVEFRQAFWSRRMQDKVSVKRSGRSGSFYWAPIVDFKIVAPVFRVKLEAKRPGLLKLRIEPPIDGGRV